MLAAAVAAVWLTLAQGASLPGTEQQAYVANSRSESAPFVARLRPAERRRVARVRFDRRTVVAAFVVTATPCYRVEVTGFTRVAKRLTVYAEVHEPAPDIGCAQAQATGYHVLSVPKLAPARRVVLRVQR